MTLRQSVDNAENDERIDGNDDEDDDDDDDVANDDADVNDWWQDSSDVAFVFLLVTR